VKGLLASQKEAEKQIDKLKAEMAEVEAGQADDQIKTIHGVKVMAKKVAIDNPAALRDLADKFRDKIQSGIVALGSVSAAKALLIVVVTRDLSGRFHAGQLIKEAATLVGGSGGGRPDMAQAGGPQPENLDLALDKICELIGAKG
jgi:alanyl-tRNA synthetase